MLYVRLLSDGFKWAPVIAALARVFGQHGMGTHAEKLARFRAGYEAQTRRLQPMGRERPWTSEELVELVELASVFHVPPFERRYPAVPDDKRCPFCRVDLAGRNAAPVAGVFADRTLHECRQCSKRWVLMKK